MIDKNVEGFRSFVNRQYVKMKRMAAVGSLILLAVNLSFTIYPYIEFRFPEYIFGMIPRAWVGVPFLLLFVIILIWFGSHIYVRKLEMYRTEHGAELLYNPYTVYQISPFEEMMHRSFSIPTLIGVYNIMPGGKDKEQVKHCLDDLIRWVDLGYIPKKDFPEHLQRYYITNLEGRL